MPSGARPAGILKSREKQERYSELLELERTGRISGLRLRPYFELLPFQITPDGVRNFRGAGYTADFAYTENGEEVIEDVRSPSAKNEKDYMLRRKLMFYINGIYVKEVLR